ncbi:movement protein [Soybean Putnam virus]|uniref:Movement protein n=1 Tax=Soybean Putnam virus TaxID=1221449 RepID=J7HA40_9VIRU|nr:movement protein [Soybean Putnam virus]AFP95346.1 movement protein [Soybean Putnam virus]
MNTVSVDHDSGSEEQAQITFNESSKGFDASLLIKQSVLSRINKTNLSLNKNDVFKIPSLGFLKRKNEVYYYVSTKEIHVDIKDTKGTVYLPFITKEEVNTNLQKIKSEVRSKISTVHLGAIKVLIKASFQAGIDSPIKMAIIDNRINDRKDCILGAARGNLCYQKFMFTVYPKFEISINTKNLDQVLSFIHHFERENLMNSGDKVFSLTYVVGYALSNSVHSIDYKHKEYIEIDQVFSDIGHVEEKQFSDISPIEDTWALDIAQNKGRLGQGPIRSIRGNTMHIGSTSRPKDISLVDISKQIDEFGKTLKTLSET